MNDKLLTLGDLVKLAEENHLPMDTVIIADDGEFGRLFTSARVAGSDDAKLLELK